MLGCSSARTIEVLALANFATGAPSALHTLSIEHCEEQVRRVNQSATFRNAVTLQQLLSFLAGKALSHSAEPLKEYTIGVEALGRKPDFDPKIDPIVRVQSHRLRLKLREYYNVEGAHDSVLIRFHKGDYHPVFEIMSPSGSFAVKKHLRDLNSSLDVDEEPPGILPPHDSPGESTWRRGRSRKALPIVTIALAIAAAYSFGNWHAKRQLGTVASTVNAGATGDEEVEAFWSRFLGNDASPVIGYTDAVFLLDDSNDLFRFRHGAIDSRGALVDPHLAREFASNPAIVAQAGPLFYENGYTGTGELEAIAMLSGLLGRLGLHPVIKSSRDITPDDLNRHNVILLGSPFQNAAVAQLFTAGDFSYQNPDQHREQWRAKILNAHPRPGEASSYRTERDPASQVLKADYSLITIANGVAPGRLIAILGGLDTKGTEGATRFASSKVGVELLEKALSTLGDNNNGDLPPFQALIQVELSKGYQVLDSRLVSVHPLGPPKSGPAEAPRPHSESGPPVP
jgi:hypothetical protein